MGEGVHARSGLTVWEACSLAYTMAAEKADRQDEILHLALMTNGTEPKGCPHREAFDEWLITVPEEV